MIEIFEGKIGGGKSYHACERIAFQCARGGAVFTNMGIKMEGLRRYLGVKYGVALDDSQITIWEDNSVAENWYRVIPPGVVELPVLVVLDEAHLLYNSRDWAKTQAEHKEMLSFLTQSRKACVDVIFISQAAENMDKQFRVLSQKIWSHRDLRQVKIPGFGKFPTWWPLPQLAATARDYTNVRMETIYKRFDTMIFASYGTLDFLDPQMQEWHRKNSARQIAARRIKKVSMWRRLWYRLDHGFGVTKRLKRKREKNAEVNDDSNSAYGLSGRSDLVE